MRWPAQWSASRSISAKSPVRRRRCCCPAAMRRWWRHGLTRGSRLWIIWCSKDCRALPRSPQAEPDMRILLLLLLLANLGFFAYHHLAGANDEATAQIALLQISPERIRTVAAGTVTPRPAGAAPGGSAQAPAACLEWSPFS